LVFVPSLILVQFFRRIRSRKSSQQESSPLRQTLYQIKQKPIPFKSKQSKLTFPWWCLFLAYGLSLLLSIVSIFFIIVRGIEFGDLKTQKWLTSLISGFFSSILLIQPIKVNLKFLSSLHENLFLSKILSLAILFSCFIRESDHDEVVAAYLDDEANLYLNNNEEYLQTMKVCLIIFMRRFF